MRKDEQASCPACGFILGSRPEGSESTLAECPSCGIQFRNHDDADSGIRIGTHTPIVTNDKPHYRSSPTEAFGVFVGILLFPVYALVTVFLVLGG